jgi:hypothetical protein
LVPTFRWTRNRPLAVAQEQVLATVAVQVADERVLQGVAGALPHQRLAFRFHRDGPGEAVFVRTVGGRLKVSGLSGLRQHVRSVAARRQHRGEEAEECSSTRHDPKLLRPNAWLSSRQAQLECATG